MPISVLRPKTRAFSLDFVDKDIRRQIELAARVVDQIEILERLRDSLPDPETKKQLQQTIDSLKDSAKGLMDNAESTSSTATTIVSAVTAAST